MIFRQLVLLCCFLAVVAFAEDNLRSKRSYYAGYDYGYGNSSSTTSTTTEVYATVTVSSEEFEDEQQVQPSYRVVEQPDAVYKAPETTTVSQDVGYNSVQEPETYAVAHADSAHSAARRGLGWEGDNKRFFVAEAKQESGCCSEDWWYAGRIFGIIAGILLLLFCCCVPCICLAGIWFLGWFGFRQRQMRKQQQTEELSAMAVDSSGAQAASGAVAVPVTVSTTTPRTYRAGDYRSGAAGEYRSGAAAAVSGASSSSSVPINVPITYSSSTSAPANRTTFLSETRSPRIAENITYSAEDRFYTSSATSGHVDERRDAYRSRF